MKHTLLRLTLLSLLITLPFGANALMDDAAASTMVQTMLADDSTPAEIIAALIEDGRTLAEATVVAMASGGKDNQVAFATAGVEAATTEVDARAVADAVLAVVAPTSDVAAAVQVATEAQVALIQSSPPPPPPPAPPSDYTGDNTATGGGAISPST